MCQVLGAGCGCWVRRWVLRRWVPAVGAAGGGCCRRWVPPSSAAVGARWVPPSSKPPKPRSRRESEPPWRLQDSAAPSRLSTCVEAPAIHSCGGLARRSDAAHRARQAPAAPEPQPERPRCRYRRSGTTQVRHGDPRARGSEQPRPCSAVARVAQQLAAFMNYLAGNIAREIGRLHDWPEKVWSRRYRSILVSQEQEAQTDRLAYLLGNGVKEGLVARPQEWPGVHCAAALLTGLPLEGHWFDRTAEYEARRRGESPSPTEFADVEHVVFSPLPCWASLHPEAYRARVAELIDGVVGVAKNTPEDLFSAGKPSSPSTRTRSRFTAIGQPAPMVHAASKAIRLMLRATYWEFAAAFREAAYRLRRGDRLVRFPPGAFPPPVPCLTNRLTAGWSKSFSTFGCGLRQWSAKPCVRHRCKPIGPVRDPARRCGTWSDGAPAGRRQAAQGAAALSWVAATHIQSASSVKRVAPLSAPPQPRTRPRSSLRALGPRDSLPLVHPLRSRSAVEQVVFSPAPLFAPLRRPAS